MFKDKVLLIIGDTGSFGCAVQKPSYEFYFMQTVKADD
jgi:hypothetical protein